MIYIKTNPLKHEYICMGISASDVYKVLNTDIVLIKSDYLGDECINNFEIISSENIDKCLSEYRFGDLCFLDCNNRENVRKLNDDEIAQMLFIGHMKRPMNSPFINKLGNSIVYMGHDDDYFCKLYCVSCDIFLDILNMKLRSYTGQYYKISKNLDCFFKDCADGILIDLAGIAESKGKRSMIYYVIGEFDNMDEIINNSKALIQQNQKKEVLLDC